MRRQKERISFTPQLMNSFFEHKLKYHCQKKRKYTKAKRKGAQHGTILSTICLDNVLHHRRTDPLPDLRNFIFPCVMRKLVDNVLYK